MPSTRNRERSHTLPSSGAPALIADMGSDLAVVLTHPWGVLGGNMHNNVLSAAVLFFQKLKVTTLRFDFVGSQIGRGYEQVQQVEEATKFLISGEHMQGGKEETSAETNATGKRKPPSSILLVGYSYGSLISASASANIPDCIGVVSIAPPYAVKHWLLMFNSQYHMDQARKRKALPRLMVIGSEDNFTNEDVFYKELKKFSPDSTTGAILKKADHFFRYRELDLMNIISKWLVKVFDLNGDLKSLRNVKLANPEAGMFHVQQSKEQNDRTGTTSELYGCTMLDTSTCTGSMNPG